MPNGFFIWANKTAFGTQMPFHLFTTNFYVFNGSIIVLWPPVLVFLIRLCTFWTYVRDQKSEKEREKTPAHNAFNCGKKTSGVCAALFFALSMYFPTFGGTALICWIIAAGLKRNEEKNVGNVVASFSLLFLNINRRYEDCLFYENPHHDDRDPTKPCFALRVRQN